MKNPHIQSASCAVVRAESKRDPQRGAALLEYALVVALISVVGISGVNSMGVIVKSKFMTASERLGVGANPICPAGEVCEERF
jgi:Flp pilus assembly pilin Flp